MAMIKRAASLLLATALTAQPVLAQTAMVTAQPKPAANIAPYFVDPASEKAMPRDQIIALLRKKVKYVFVVFNENHSFDNEYGTFPGANVTGAKPRAEIEFRASYGAGDYDSLSSCHRPPIHQTCPAPNWKPC